MSTKCSVAWGDNFHFYSECFDDENVFLQLDGIEFEASRDSVMVAIPKAIFAVIQSCNVISTDLICLSDADIQAKVERAVDERIEERAGKDGIMALMGSGVYGSPDDSRERQIGRGIAWYTEERRKQIKWRDDAAKIVERMVKHGG